MPSRWVPGRESRVGRAMVTRGSQESSWTRVCCDKEVQGWEVKLLAQVWDCDGQGWAQGHLQHSLGRDQEQGLELNTPEGAEIPSKASPSSAPRSQVQLNDSELALSSGPQRGRRGCRA